MKAALIGAVALGGATAAALTWTYLATGDPHPPAERAADARLAAAPAPAAPAVSKAGDPPARAAPGGPDRPALSPEPDSARPAEQPDFAARDAPAPIAGSPTPAASPDRLAAVAPEAAEPAAPRPNTAARDPAPPDAPRADLAPSFDVVRIDAEGQTVIAGRAAPHERVEVLLDGSVVETMLADAGGRFVAVLSTGSSGSARELRLRVTLPAEARYATPQVPDASAPGPGGSAGTSAPPASGPPAAPGPVARPGTASAHDPGPPAGSRAGSTAAGMPARPASPASPASRAGADGAPPEGTASLPARQPAQATIGERAPAPPPSAPPDMPAPGRETRGQAAAAGALAPPAEPNGGRHLLSDPVIILPTEDTGDAPAVVRVQDERLALLQPGGADATGVVLDQLTREPGGDLLLRGRARPGHAVRIYGNDKALETVPVDDGGWSVTVPETRADAIRLFRLDEIARSGAVASRIEVPFQPTDAPAQVVRDRRITVHRGDNLWRIAEQHYGEGIRYSLIFGANSDLIRDPDLIYPDQVFTIPELVEAE